MATAQSFLNNFPVKFNNEVDDCLACDDRPFCQLAQWSDRFEFAYEPSTTEVTIVNGTFTGSLAGWTVSVAGWTYNGGKARLTNAAGQLDQNISHVVGRKYKICFEVSNYSGTGTMSVYLGDVPALAEVSANGSYCLIVVPGNPSPLSFLANDATFILDLDNVTVELVNQDCGIKLYNTATGAYSSTTLSANLSSPYITTLGYSYLWSAFNVSAEGCYKIAVYDKAAGSNLVVNGTFTGSLSGWTAGSYWDQFSPNRACITWLGNDANAVLSQTISPSVAIGQTVTITFTLPFYLAGALIVSFDGVTIATITAGGTYSFQRTMTSSNNLLSFLGTTNASGPAEFCIDDVSLTVMGCAMSELSECYKIATTHACTKLLKWTNQAVNGFNYPYYYFYNGTTAGFQWLRVEANMRNSKYPGESEKYIDSGGNDILYYGSRRKNKILYIGPLPEYLHDAIAEGMSHKAFYIDSVRYSIQDTDYEPEEGNERILLSESQILVGKYTQDDYGID